ncbi:HEPN domain-containing protein [Vibrio chagasii]|uniref:HEPN domain-containing protein n=1 Tax=Vibrio crassostreae TaxID=246167 RepID=A0A822MU59_9VIBR|nr:hypothetical protein [Vibrio crassostreae]CAH6804837.1 HEPN domain-containing protein [Vibrio chagasii]MDH5950446.1 hypothetical protein [Vibrio crassostreae]TCN06112.1 hypothetical protein EDB35_11491 [Vibrio crassostreae]TCT41298.1 hypothetical protein EDB29_10391 [Vibrio crassostreae]TCU05477.1 hypothetical protein EDB32_11664 [Vibrio crassostreae]
MPTKADEFLTTAESVFKLNGSCESHIRCTISRSYYSMYHKVLETLDNSPYAYTGKGCHASLIEYLQSDAKNEERIDFSQLRRLSYMLKQEKDRRVDADYRLEFEFSGIHAEQSIQTAKRCSQMCDDLKI